MGNSNHKQSYSPTDNILLNKVTDLSDTAACDNMKFKLWTPISNVITDYDDYNKMPSLVSVELHHIHCYYRSVNKGIQN